jgi:hypothetical protein
MSRDLRPAMACDASRTNNADLCLIEETAHQPDVV